MSNPNDTQLRLECLSTARDTVINSPPKDDNVTQAVVDMAQAYYDFAKSGDKAADEGAFRARSVA